MLKRLVNGISRCRQRAVAIQDCMPVSTQPVFTYDDRVGTSCTDPGSDPATRGDYTANNMGIEYMLCLQCIHAFYLSHAAATPAVLRLEPKETI